MTDLTVVLTNYLRPNNVAKILDSLARQTLSHELFVWDNSPNQDFTGKADWIVRSSRNCYCSPRWWLASQASSEYVVIHDDDLLPRDPELLAIWLDELRRFDPSPVSIGGTRLLPGRCWARSHHIGRLAAPPRRDERVDLLHCGYMGIRTNRLRDLPFMPIGCHDDLIVSHFLNGGIVSKRLARKWRWSRLPTGEESLNRGATFARSRNVLVRRLFQHSINTQRHPDSVRNDAT